MFYTHETDVAPSPGMNTLRVQIWRPVGGAGDNEFELIWEHQEQGLEIGSVGVLWRVRLILRYRESNPYSEISNGNLKSTFEFFPN